MLSAVIFTAVVSYAQSAKTLSYPAIRVIGNFLSNSTVLGGFLVAIVIGLLVIKYVKLSRH